MADMNDFLKKLGLAQAEESTLPSIPLRLDQPEAVPVEAPVAPKKKAAKKSTSLPEMQIPEESDMASGSKDDATLEQEIQDAAKDSDVDLTTVNKPEELAIPKEDTQMSRYKQLLDEYKSRQANLGMLQGANQIAQAMAAGYGGKIGDGSESVKMLQGQLQDPLKQIQAEDSTEKMDPKSDVSRLYREQAYALLKKISPDKNYDGQLENMSAAQLEKLPGLKEAFKQQGGIQKAVGFGQFIDAKTNQPLHFDQATNSVVNSITGQKVGPETQIVRPVAYNDPYSGQRGYFTQNGMMVPGGNQVQPQQTVNEQTGQTERVAPKYADFAKKAPRIAEQFDAKAKEFRADMKESRDVATSVTNLASKLKPGPDNKVDSGLLGGIQTQAAKMAGQKGVLTDQDLVKFAGAGGVQAKIDRIIDGSLFGEMTDADVKFFKRFAQLMGKSLESDVNNRAQLFIDQTRQNVEGVVPGVQDSDMRTWLGVDKVAPVVQDKQPGKMRKIKTPSGTVMNIPEDQLKNALAKGAVEVK